MYKIRYDKLKNKDFRAAIMNCIYPSSEKGSNRTTAAVMPKHDETAHYRTALEYIMSYLEFNMDSRKEKKHLSDDRLIRDYRTGQLIKP